MKKALLILLTVVVFLVAGYRIFVAPPQVKEESIPYNSIICFGDSLTFGTGAEAGMDYPSQLSQMIAKPVINAGVPGDTTARALKRLQRDVLARSPDLVLITLGGNDLKNGIAKDTAFNNLEHIVESIQGQGARVIIGGLKFPLRDRGFAKGYKEIADQTGAVLIPDIFKDIMGNRKLLRDPIHPNGNGYRIMAQSFLDAILSR
jgi:acyl-CoA thioesterase-1